VQDWPGDRVTVARTFARKGGQLVAQQGHGFFYLFQLAPSCCQRGFHAAYIEFAGQAGLVALAADIEQTLALRQTLFRTIVQRVLQR
jgi:hypothetical protein